MEAREKPSDQVKVIGLYLKTDGEREKREEKYYVKLGQKQPGVQCIAELVLSFCLSPSTGQVVLGGHVLQWGWIVLLAKVNGWVVLWS